MAEFSELVRIKKKICIKYKSSGCIGCPIDCRKGHLCGIISISGYSDNEFMELEEALLSWGAEHPEPVYPSWYEYLTDMYPASWNMIKDKPIPADLAQKLGIEPKEG